MIGQVVLWELPRKNLRKLGDDVTQLMEKLASQKERMASERLAWADVTTSCMAGVVCLRS